jgi:C-terminal peptidase prc
MREGYQDMLSFDVTRDVVKEQSSLSFYIKDHDIYYISLSTFSDNSVKQMEELLTKANAKESKGLILDLRNNSGGLLTAAVEIAGLFLEKGSLVVVTKDKHGNELEQWSTTREPIAKSTTPIFIITNNYAASAAEILAGCLKIHAEQAESQVKKNKRNSLVFVTGTTSFGKGSVQTVIPLKDCAAKLTTALYYLPDHTTIQGKGIQPDFFIEKNYPATEQIQWFNKSYGREQAFENHIKPDAAAEEIAEAIEQKQEEKNMIRWLDRAKKMMQTDNQLRETIVLINVLNAHKALNPKKSLTRSEAAELLKNHYLANGSLNIEPVSM